MKQEIDGVKQEMKQEMEKQERVRIPVLVEFWFSPGQEQHFWSNFLIYQHVHFKSFKFIFHNKNYLDIWKILNLPATTRKCT